jgi:hypothetical protein
MSMAAAGKRRACDAEYLLTKMTRKMEAVKMSCMRAVETSWRSTCCFRYG